MRARVIVGTILGACAALAACGGGGSSGVGGGSSIVPVATATAAPQPTSAKSQAVKFSLSIPLASSGNATRRRNFTSSATNGAFVAVTSTGGASTQAVVDLSATSNACTTAGSTRTCTVTITVPIGNDTFTITTYDTAPVNGAIPAGAHELGIGSTTATITSSSPGVSISINGLIANLGVMPPFASLPSDGATHQISLILSPSDYGNQPIVTGTNATFANPISVTLTETGGSGHAILIFDNAPSGLSATLSHSSDTISVQYDGGGVAGYSVALTVAAAGITPSTTTISPLFVSGTGLVSNVLTLTTAATPVTVTISEFNAPSTQQYSAGATSACTGIATSTSATGGGSSATFTVTGSTTPSDQCTIAISDGTNFLTLTLDNNPGGVTPAPTPTPATPAPTPTLAPTPPGTGSVTIPGASITEYTGYASAPDGIASGPDGDIYFTEFNVGKVGVLNPANGSLLGEAASGGGSNIGITAGSDGALWVTDGSGTPGVDRVDTSGNATVYPMPGGLPNGITSDANGLLWVADDCAKLWELSVTGIWTKAPITPTYGPTDVIAATDGNIYFTEGQDVGQYNPSTQAFAQLVVSAVGSTQYLAQGGDGNLWITDSNSNIYRVSPTSFTVTGTYPLGGAASPLGITAGADGAMWYVDPGNNVVGRILTASPNTVSTMAIPTTNSQPQQIVLGHDGTLWFTENTAPGKIGHLIP